MARDNASSSSFSTAGSDANAAHAHAAAAAAEAATEGLGSSGSKVISAIISRSSGERTDDEYWAPFGQRALDDDEVAE